MAHLLLAVVLLLLACVVTQEGLDSPPTLQESYYPQPLDHLGDGNMSTLMFNQRYIVDRRFWAGPKSKSPLLVYFGGESSLDGIPESLGIIKEAAPRFRALVMYIEHRFYGKSIPFGSLDISMEDEEVRGCLTSEQALMDFAEILLTAKKNLLGRHAPIIVFGCSYSGMLAAWFRLKLPHIATGALASSAPIFFFDMDVQWENKYCEVVSHDFKVVNEKCYNRIKESWDLINNISKETYGLDKLEKMFNTCSPLLTVDELTSSLVGIYSRAAQYNGRFNTLINGICNEIVHAPDTDILGAISRAAVAARGGSCYELGYPVNSVSSQELDENSARAWSWQVCNEFVMRRGCSNGTMFQPSAYNLSDAISYCTNKYNVRPKLHRVSTYYGGYNLRYSLRNFASDIIFSNGLMDPFSAFGVLEDLSETVIAISTKQGSHCLDFPNSQTDDPKWLRNQREEEINLLARWMQESEQSSTPTTLLRTNLQVWFVGLGFSLLQIALLV